MIVLSQLAFLRGQTSLPLCVGFGVSKPEHVAIVARGRGRRDRRQCPGASLENADKTAGSPMSSPRSADWRLRWPRRSTGKSVSPKRQARASRARPCLALRARRMGAMPCPSRKRKNDGTSSANSASRSPGRNPRPVPMDADGAEEIAAAGSSSILSQSSAARPRSSLTLAAATGRFLIGSAVWRTDRDHIGIDVLPLIIRYATRRANQRGLTNIRFAVVDGCGLVQHYRAPHSVSEIHMLSSAAASTTRATCIGDSSRRRFWLFCIAASCPADVFSSNRQPRLLALHPRIVPVFFDLHERIGNWPDAPKGRTRREIIALRRGLPVCFAGQERPKLALRVREEALRLAQELPPPVSTRIALAANRRRGTAVRLSAGHGRKPFWRPLARIPYNQCMDRHSFTNGNTPQVTFFGAAQSGHRLDAPRRSRQSTRPARLRAARGPRDEARSINRHFPFDPTAIDAVVLSQRPRRSLWQLAQPRPARASRGRSTAPPRRAT